jgi:hypothetical protein
LQQLGGKYEAEAPAGTQRRDGSDNEGNPDIRQAVRRKAFLSHDPHGEATVWLGEVLVPDERRIADDGVEG